MEMSESFRRTDFYDKENRSESGGTVGTQVKERECNRYPGVFSCLHTAAPSERHISYGTLS